VNPVPTWGGDEAESVEEGERRIPAFLRHRDRLVSAEDFAEITRATPGVDLGRVEILPLFHPDLPEAPAQGVVTVLVIPVNDTEQAEAPRPDLLFLETVCRHLEPRRLVTTELHVRGPVYRPVWVSLGFDVVPGRDQGPVREAVRAAVRRFLSPLAGGFEGRGWPLGKAVEAGEISAAATRVDGVAKVNGLLLGGETGGAVLSLPLVGLELPRLMGLAVESGEPVPLEQVRGEAPEPPPADGRPVVPVPIVPEEC
jgi:predicted phage baseplate assembly protein